MSGAFLRRRDRTARPPRVVHYSSAVNRSFLRFGNQGTGNGGGSLRLGLLRENSHGHLSSRLGYLSVSACAVLPVWMVDLFEISALAFPHRHECTDVRCAGSARDPLRAEREACICVPARPDTDAVAARLMGPARARPMVLGVPELQRGKSGEGKGDAGNGHCCKHPPCQQVEPTARTVGLEETSVVHEFSLSLPLGHRHFRACPREGHNSIAEVGTRTKDKEPDARRHPHRRARSASQNGISRGPRACRVRVSAWPRAQ